MCEVSHIDPHKIKVQLVPVALVGRLGATLLFRHPFPELEILVEDALGLVIETVMSEDEG